MTLTTTGYMRFIHDTAFSSVALRSSTRSYSLAFSAEAQWIFYSQWDTATFIPVLSTKDRLDPWGAGHTSHEIQHDLSADHCRKRIHYLLD